MFRTMREFFTALFTPPTIIDDVVQRTHKATADVQACESTIQKARYQKHMAISELRALEAWNHGRVLEDMLVDPK